MESAICYGDKVILTQYDHGVVLEYMSDVDRYVWPDKIRLSRISAISLTGVMLLPEIQSATYEHWSGKTFAKAVKHLIVGEGEGDPATMMTLSWDFLTKAGNPGEIFELIEAITARKIAPKMVDGIDYIADVTLKCTRDGATMQHVLKGVGAP